MFTSPKLLIFLSLFICISSGCSNPPAASTVNNKKTAIKIPNNQTECLARGGTWKAMGIFPEEICNLPTKDGGKSCSSSNECEGSCLAVLNNDEQSALMKGDKKGMKVPGQCSNSLRNIGCLGFVEDGKVDQIICLD